MIQQDSARNHKEDTLDQAIVDMDNALCTSDIKGNTQAPVESVVVQHDDAKRRATRGAAMPSNSARQLPYCTRAPLGSRRQNSSIEVLGGLACRACFGVYSKHILSSTFMLQRPHMPSFTSVYATPSCFASYLVCRHCSTIFLLTITIRLLPFPCTVLSRTVDL